MKRRWSHVTLCLLWVTHHTLLFPRKCTCLDVCVFPSVSTRAVLLASAKLKEDPIRLVRCGLGSHAHP
jgi:hypothetical protein